ncbi:hypothetical protein Tco_1448758 [Tanacetum coccineum]
MASDDSDQDAEYALSRLLQRGTVAEYQKEFEILVSRVTGKSESLLASIYTFGLKPALIRALLWSNPTTLGEAFALARVAEAQDQHLEEITFHKSNKVEETKARFEAIAEKEHNIKEKVDTTLSLPSDEASPVVKGPLDASEDTLLFLRSEDPNFKIHEYGVKYVRALNVVPLEVVFTGPVDEVSSVIEDVFDIDESNVEGMHVRDKFAEFFEDKGSMKKVLSATKLPKGGNSHSTYSPYHLEDKVNFEGVGNITPSAAKVGRRKRVKCYVQGSGRRKKKKVIRRGSGRQFVMARTRYSGANLSLLLLYILTEQAHAKSGATIRYNPKRVVSINDTPVDMHKDKSCVYYDQIEDERFTTTIAKANDLNTGVQVQDLELETKVLVDGKQDDVKVVKVVGVASHQNNDEPNVLKGNGVIGVRVNKNNKRDDKEVQYSVYALHVLNPLLKRLNDKYIKKKRMEAVIQRRLWDPGIKSVFQDNTLRAM